MSHQQFNDTVAAEEQWRVEMLDKHPSLRAWPGRKEKETMSDQPNTNMALWERVCVTDPKAVKPITGKQYSGNSPKPYWIVQRLTQEFGPCGLGWGYSILNERMERLTETDVLHVAAVRFWYVLDGKRGEVEQIGQTKAVYKTSKGALLVDEDAPKKSVTDALVKCASYIGVAGDIFSGRWDDSKYVAWAREQYADDEPTKHDPIAPTFRSSPTMGEMEALPQEQQEYIRDLAMEVLATTKTDPAAAFAQIEGEQLDDTQKMALWALLDSKTRAAIKKAQQAAREKATA